MTWFLGLRTPVSKINFGQIRTHVSRAAKKVAEQQPGGAPSRAVPNANAKAVTPPGSSAKLDPQVSRKSKIAKSLFPKFMRSYASKINNAPVSHIASFLLVHELSAVVPLFGLWGAFHYFDYMPLGVPDILIEEGSKFIRRMAERNNWESVMYAEKGSRVILQGAAAYFIVKAILPLRLIFSLWAMPWFARVFVVPINSRIAAYTKRFLKKDSSNRP